MLSIHLELLDEKHRRVFDRLGALKEQLYLSGGTALSLQIAHRLSYDFDLFLSRALTRADRVKVKSLFRVDRVNLDIPDQLDLIVEDEVKITLLDNENVSIKIKGNVVKKNYAELGFKDSRTGKPSKLWLYFEGLLSSNGEITNYPTTEKAIIEKNISDLRRMLKRCFAINDDPIPYKKTKDYTGYKTDFLIEGKSYTRDYEESIRKNNKKGIPQKGNRYKNETEDLDNETNIDD